MKTNFMKLIKDGCSEKGISLSKLAKSCNIPPSTVLNYSWGSEPSLFNSLKMLDKLNISRDRLKFK